LKNKKVAVLGDKVLLRLFSDYHQLRCL